MVKNPTLYYKSLYMKYYHFYQQYKDHFNRAGVTNYQNVPFMALFFRDKINFWW